MYQREYGGIACVEAMDALIKLFSKEQSKLNRQVCTHFCCVLVQSIPFGNAPTDHLAALCGPLFSTVPPTWLPSWKRRVTKLLMPSYGQVAMLWFWIQLQIEEMQGLQRRAAQSLAKFAHFLPIECEHVSLRSCSFRVRNAVPESEKCLLSMGIACEK